MSITSNFAKSFVLLHYFLHFIYMTPFFRLWRCIVSDSTWQNVSGVVSISRIGEWLINYYHAMQWIHIFCKIRLYNNIYIIIRLYNIIYMIMRLSMDYITKANQSCHECLRCQKWSIKTLIVRWLNF